MNVICRSLAVCMAVTVVAVVIASTCYDYNPVPCGASGSFCSMRCPNLCSGYGVGGGISGTVVDPGTREATKPVEVGYQREELGPCLYRCQGTCTICNVTHAAWFTHAAINWYINHCIPCP